MSDPSKSAKLAKLVAGTAFAIVRDDVSKPLVARSYARKSGMGRPSLYEAFEQLEITEKPPSAFTRPGGSTYVLPKDTVLLMIGQTAELEAACKVANEKGFNFIEAQEGSTLHLRYARIKVAMGRNGLLSCAAEVGWPR
jgi:hypothetical protein